MFKSNEALFRIFNRSFDIQIGSTDVCNSEHVTSDVRKKCQRYPPFGSKTTNWLDVDVFQVWLPRLHPHPSGWSGLEWSLVQVAPFGGGSTIPNHDLFFGVPFFGDFALFSIFWHQQNLAWKCLATDYGAHFEIALKNAYGKLEHSCTNGWHLFPFRAPKSHRLIPSKPCHQSFPNTELPMFESPEQSFINLVWTKMEEYYVFVSTLCSIFIVYNFIICFWLFLYLQIY